MIRHDPLSSLSPEQPVAAPPVPAAPRKKSARKAARAPAGTGLLAQVAAVPDSMLAYLEPGRPAAEVRAGFAGFCATRHFPDWRAAWSAFQSGNGGTRTNTAGIIPVTFTRTVEQPVPVVEAPLPSCVPAPAQSVPLWLQRARQRLPRR